MTATTRVDFGLVKGLGAGVGRKAARAMTHASAARRTTGRINAVRTQPNANVGWGRESLGGSESLVRSSVGSLRVSSPRYLAPTKTPTTKHTTTTLRRAIGGSGSFDEGDPSETPALVSKQSEESAGDMKEVAFWVAAACLFGAGVGLVDNLFVFVLVFEYFKVPPTQQTKVLSYGIGGTCRGFPKLTRRFTGDCYKYITNALWRPDYARLCPARLLLPVCRLPRV
jgi:hypothetical protein